MNKNYLTLVLAIIATSLSFAQAPVITGMFGPGAACSAPGTPSSFSVSATNGPTSFVWLVAPSNGAVIVNGNTSNPSISFQTQGNYTVYCTASNGSGSSGPSSKTITVFETPTVTFSGNTNLFCQGSSTNLSASPTIYSASSTLSYSWTPSTGLSTTTGSAVVASPAVSTNYTVILTMGICKNTAQLFVNVNPFLVNITPPSVTVCKGSSANLSASGSTSYTWSNGSTTPSINVLPPANSNFTVTAVDSNGCLGSKVVAVNVDNTCSDVWPGDANSDGVVDNSDALELGFNYLSTGSPRNITSNNYSAHYAANWSGTLSSGKNKVHADCNGDGTIDLGDTLAIYNNYSLTHSFRSSAASGIPIILASSSSNMVAPGEWSKLDIILGADNSLVNIYGLVFDINYDNSMINSGDVYVKFTPSFLNNNNQNVEFQKPIHSAGKIHIADIRTDGSNVFGFGKIGEFYFKVKQEIPQGVVINVSASNAGKVKNDRSTEPLVGNQLPLAVTNIPVSVTKAQAETFILYPNPVFDKLIIKGASGETGFVIYDITGRVVHSGVFTNSTEIEASQLAPGSYSIRLTSSGGISTHKLLIQK